MIIVAGNALLHSRFYSVTGTFSLTLRVPCVYRQTGWETMRYLSKPNAYSVFIARVNRGYINTHRVVTTLIPIGQYPKLTVSQQPAVSSFKAYQTPAR
jgi:hypothetical protein